MKDFAKKYPPSGISTDKQPAGDHMYSLLPPVHSAKRISFGSHEKSVKMKKKRSLYNMTTKKRHKHVIIWTCIK